MKYLKFYTSLFFLSAITFLNAQEVTNYDLERFAKAYAEMVQLNLKAQNKMADLIADEDLDLEVYHAINDTKNNPEIEPDVPKSDFEKFEKIQPKIEKVQAQLETDVTNAYAKQDLTKREYTAIAERVKQDPLLQTRLEKLLAQIKKY